MNTIAIRHPEKKKKLIELPTDICQRLAIQAAIMGTSVKHLIESIVVTFIEDSDDEALYAYLCQTRPEGSEMMSDDAQNDLLDRLRKKAIQP